MVKLLTLDFGSGSDLTVVRSSPASGSTLSVESAWDSLSPSLSQNKYFKTFFIEDLLPV